MTQNDFNRGNYNKYLGLDANVSDKMQRHNANTTSRCNAYATPLCTGCYATRHPVCVCSCLATSRFVVNRWQSEQAHGVSPVCVRSCLATLRPLETAST